MSEDYQHACERAELLGLPRPSEEEWRQSQAAQSENRCDDDDDGALQVTPLRLAYVTNLESGLFGVCSETCQNNSLSFV